MADYHPLVVDKRIIERNIQKGLISRKDFERHLSELPDCGENAELVSFEPPAAAADEEPGDPEQL